jgi:NADH-quinone oxidoreductase subunit A
MEMVFMYPWAVVFIREGLTAFVEMGMFIGILLLGILYAWRERAFAWA